MYKVLATEITLNDKDVKRLRSRVEDYLQESFFNRMKDIQKKFHLSPDYTDGITYQTLESLSYDLVNQTNDSGEIYEFIEYLKEEDQSGVGIYDRILENYLFPESKPVEEKVYEEKE